MNNINADADRAADGAANSMDEDFIQNGTSESVVATTTLAHFEIDTSQSGGGSRVAPTNVTIDIDELSADDDDISDRFDKVGHGFIYVNIIFAYLSSVSILVKKKMFSLRTRTTCHRTQI